ncbi:undecaprenyl-diphosphatase [Sediminihabitans luteus]|uniref:Undecaprenyl-diphosphatase n=1 Tax=Sediminihabitans luteus TaxID=1138585 RepID=A0A2M9D139_9CELL|nr:phosphatase PAP2 family protein [Sediminihabitans luteus]PJJ77889.1 undecaprenyl-diphosphatase [Sediminihabitans luteus]GII99753.1 hypothetical protein Slu03_21310 [Sediminihabitans luteus]
MTTTTHAPTRRQADHPFVHRYEIDTSRPTVGEAARDLGLRALLPAVALWAVITGIGLLIVGPLNDLPAEEGVNDWFAENRSGWGDTVSGWFSLAGSTPFVIAMTVITCLVLLWRSRQWWFAVVPAIAVSVQALVFVTAATVVGRDRPEVEKLDDSPPTASYPSGHTGASTALFFTLAMLAQRIEHTGLRWTVTILCVAEPLLVGTARLYRGMHHVTDVGFAIVNGLVCVLLAWAYLRRRAAVR